MDKLSHAETIKLETTVDGTITENGKKLRLCQRCLKHGQPYPMRYHKHECKFKFCPCPTCVTVGTRQRRTRTDARKRRAKAKFMFKEELSKISRGTGVVPPVNWVQPMPQVPQPLMTYTAPPESPDFNFGSNTDLTIKLLERSASLLAQYGFEALALLYTILEDCRSDEKLTIQRIERAHVDIQRAICSKASSLGRHMHHQDFLQSITTFGSPTYIDPVPCIGKTPLISTTGLGIFPYTTPNHDMSAKMFSNVDGSPKWTLSYPAETSISQDFKEENTRKDTKDTIYPKDAHNVCTRTATAS